MDNIEIILASASPRRHEILLAGGIRHRVLVAGADESVPDGTGARRMVEILSLRKADAAVRSILSGGCAERTDNCADFAERGKKRFIVIGADTVVEHEGSILGKPKSPEDARRMLSALSGGVHTVYTGMTVTDGEKTVTDVTKTSVEMRRISESELDLYIATGSPLDKAGAYGIQEFGGRFVSHINGDFMSVAGLSLCALSRILCEDFGYVPPME